MQLLITGATGFLGKHVVKHAIDQGHTTAALLRSDSDQRRVDSLPSAVTQTNYDGTIDSLRPIFAKGVDAVIHLAAMIPKAHNPSEISRLIASNVTYGTHLLEAAADAGCRYFVNTGTHWEYYHSKTYAPVNLYAASKHALQQIMAWYQAAREIQTINLILFDTYGAGDHRSKLFTFLKKASAAGEILAMSPGEQWINLIHVEDAARGFLHAIDLLEAKKVEAGQCFALGGSTMPLQQVVELYNRCTNKPCTVQWGAKPYREREILEPWQGAPLPGFVCRISLEDGIKSLLRE